MNSFSLEQYIRSSGAKEFSMIVLQSHEDFIELEVRAENVPGNPGTFKMYIERNIVFGKTALDGFKKYFAGLGLSDANKKARAMRRQRIEEIYREMIGR